jgi:acyl dehydratase
LSSLARRLFENVVAPAGITQMLNNGLEKIRFVAPVNGGSYMRNRIKFLAVDQKSNARKRRTSANTMEIKGEPKPALAAVALVLAVVS